MPKKQGKRYRWETGRDIFAACHALPSTTHAAVLHCCWFYADGCPPEFNLTKQQIADQLPISVRTVRRVLGELEDMGVIATLKRGCNNGRSLPSVRQIKPPATWGNPSEKGVMQGRCHPEKGVTGGSKRGHTGS